VPAAVWLSAGLKKLLTEVNEHGVPDPLEIKKAVNGLVQLLQQAEVPVGLLSTDLSGLGAIAFGALWSAIGVRDLCVRRYRVLPRLRQERELLVELVL
jgi:hypothetical protein